MILVDSTRKVEYVSKGSRIRGCHVADRDCAYVLIFIEMCFTFGLRQFRSREAVLGFDVTFSYSRVVLATVFIK